ncbi:outer membrane-specific lipoprotein transporter subunit LolC [Symmachiella macrocystis]|uniref:Outer membrane-specific lipoprotein transporter subunit LolC n=1 Tax=Symmachiella macrocystis TaxID=2527985 RepID=A0A5C6AYZ0_9PLAN|nr:ABC transporter permease [Symmachiella macrocystis]TWU05255.1 outer membrane-specific lipoprotein transporter subunit LolC [Symmachiella macrocystis]
MFKFAPYLFKTLWRHRVRTLLTVSGSAVALFVFCFVLSVQQGLERLTQQDNSVLVVFQANKFCPATSHLPQDYDRVIGKMPGVRDVLPIQVFTNNCRASLDVVVFYGTQVEKIRRLRNFELVTGSWADFEGHQDAAIVGRALATRRGISVGEKFSIGDVTVAVAGIYTSENRAEEDYVYCHLDFLQRTHGLDLVGTVTQQEVWLDNSADPDQTAVAIDAQLKSGQIETDTRTKGAFQASSIADLVHLIDLSHYLGWACLLLMAVLLGTTTIMTVEDRIGEHAVLQTLGFTTFRVFRLVMSEAVLLSVLGGCLGTALATVFLFESGLSLGAEAVSIAIVPTWNMAIYAVVTSLVIGIIAGIAPATHAARADIVTSLRMAR